MHIVIVGGGIAGVGAGYELAAEHDVVLLEQEPLLAYHTTGRSAALFTENYGDGTVRPLTTASRRFFDDPPDGFTDSPLLTPRRALFIARDDQIAALHHLHDLASARSNNVRLLGADDAVALCPVIRADRIAAALLEPDAADIDVATLHQGFVRGLRARGGTIHTESPLTAGHFDGSRWQIEVGAKRLGADLVVNAAGAWGDVVAARCGVTPVGLTPRRRTAFMVAAPRGAAGWPMVIDADEEFYFKPDGIQLLCSPADETPSPPVDARPDEIDVAIAIERINAATTLGLRHVRSQWAGLRTFAPDRAMVIGRDPVRPSFVWLVGQGGTGIQSAPAAARLAASIVDDLPTPADMTAAGLDATAVDPARLRSSE